MEKTNWKIVGTGLGLIILCALLVILLDMNAQRWVGIIILLIVGFALTVAGSADQRNNGTHRES